MTEQLYDDLASWWTVLSPSDEREEEAAQILRWLAGPARLLELGSGIAPLTPWIPDAVELTLVDGAPRMVEAARGLYPSRTHVVGDMRTIALETTYDAVLLHDAVMYLRTEADLRAAFQTAWNHLEPGGRFCVLPDFVAEDFEEHLVSGTRSVGDRTVAMTEWHWDPDPTDGTVQVDFTLLLREGGTMRAVHDRHVMGLHPRERFWRLLRSIGFEPVEVPFDDLRAEGDVFLVRRPA